MNLPKMVQQKTRADTRKFMEKENVNKGTSFKIENGVNRL